jgi:hypothetical protein
MLSDRYELARAQQKRLQNLANTHTLQKPALKKGFLAGAYQKISKAAGYLNTLRHKETFKRETALPKAQDM